MHTHDTLEPFILTKSDFSIFSKITHKSMWHDSKQQNIAKHINGIPFGRTACQCG